MLYVGRVDPEKSISNVVSAFAGVLDKVQEAQLVIVGDGTDRRHLQDLAEALGIAKSVHFPGRIYPPDIMEIYRAATIFVTASETETQRHCADLRLQRRDCHWWQWMRVRCASCVSIKEWDSLSSG